MATLVSEIKSSVDGSIQHTPSFCSLNFPRPHRLGASSGIHPSHSSQASLAHPSPITPSTTTLARATPKHLPELVTSGNSFPETSHELEEVDSGPPPAKRIAVASKLKKTQRAPIVNTFNDSPLSEFVLYLPPKLPMTIVNSRSALVEFVQQTASTYLSLWDLSTSLKLLDLRFPSSYSECFSDDPHFISELLESIFEQLSHVRSIKEAYLPQIVFHASTQLEAILGALAKTKCAISHLFLPMKCSLKANQVECLDYKSQASFLRKTKVHDITLISTDDVVEDIQERLKLELKKGSRKSTVALHFSDHMQSEPGPAYISELGQEQTVGEMVDPLSLVSSLNTPLGGGVQGLANTSDGSTHHVHKIKVRGAFTTDCTYSDDAELSSDGPFASKIWNLDRLHAEGYDGSGTTIAVIDSGINYTHPAFKDRVIAVKNFVSEEIDDIDCVIDSDGHGTHCAGIAAGSAFYCPLNASKSDSPCIIIPPGVAPGAKLVICKVVRTTTGEVDTSAFLDALKWIKQLHNTTGNRIDVLSISLASTYYSHERAQVISELTSLGIIVVCCASNVGRLRLQPISFPARLGHVLCIGAHDENGKPTSFSPVGRELDFLAPGDNLWGPGPGTVGPFAMDCASGTSCATPAVAGLISVILQAISNICEEESSNEDVSMVGGKLLIDLVRNVWVMRELLKEMSSSPGHHSEEIGYGTLNPYRVLDRSAEEIRRVINEIIEDE